MGAHSEKSRVRVKGGFSAVFILLFTLLMAGQVVAQCKSSDFVGAEGVNAAPSRPGESFVADPVEVGVLQSESGVTRNWQSSNLRSASVFNMLRFGVWCNFEIRWSGNNYDSQTSPVNSAAGFGDTFLTVHYRYHRESKHSPSLAVAYEVKFATADAASGLGSGKMDHIVTLMGTKNVGKLFVESNMSLFAIGEATGGTHGKAEWTLLMTHPVWHALGVVGEVYGDSRLDGADAAYASSTWGATYNVSRRLVLDGGAMQGLTSGPGAPGRSLFVGMTYAFGSVYQPNHVRIAVAPNAP